MIQEKPVITKIRKEMKAKKLETRGKLDYMAKCVHAGKEMFGVDFS